MKSIQHKITGTFFCLQAALVATAAAHPGTPGHTHTDEWPFGVLIVAGVAIASLSFGIIQYVRKRSK